MTATIAERVGKGAALLDEKLPGWEYDIDLNGLDIASPCRCILGQLHYNENDPGDSYMDGMDAVGLPNRADWMYGFDAAGDYPDRFGYESELLTAEWKRLILARREAGRS